jgi:microcystin-dependent protein
LSGTTGSAGTHRHGIWADNNNTAGSGAITLTSDTGSDYDVTPQTGAEGNGAYLSDEGAHTHSLSGTLSGTTGDGSPALQGLPHGNMQPYVVMQYIIKL